MDRDLIGTQTLAGFKPADKATDMRIEVVIAGVADA